MKLLQESIEIYENSFLLEDLGNLNIIDKELLKAFKFTTTSYVGDKKKTIKKLGNVFGKDSKITTKVFKSAKNALESFEEDKNAIGMVFRIYSNEKQFMAVGKEKGIYGTKGSNEKFSVVANGEPLYNIGVDFTEMNKASGNGVYLYKDRTSSTTANHGVMYKILTGLKKAITARGEDIETVVIYIDEERGKKKAERSAARQGMIPLPRDESAWEFFNKKAKAELSARLNKLKTTKAKTVDGPNELLNLIKEEGYLDKINVSGLPFELSDDRINFKGLKGDKWYGESYIEYKVNKDSDTWKKIRNVMVDLHDQFYNKRITKEEYEKEIATKGAPSSFKIILKLDGGKIVPSELQFPKTNDVW